MIHMRFKGDGGDFRELDVETVDELRPRMVAAVRGGVDLLEARAKSLISRRYGTRVIRSRAKGGSVFSRKGRTLRVVNIPSAPGDPPGMGSGELLQSIKAQRPRKGGKLRVRGAVFTKLHFAATLEFGGRVFKHGRVAPRPFFRPAQAQVEPLVDRMFREAL